MAKATWEPTTDDIRRYVLQREICIVCWKTGHAPIKCPKYNKEDGLMDYSDVGDYPEFYPYLREWSEKRIKQGKTLIAIVEVLIEHTCSRCRIKGHDRMLCKTILKCVNCHGDHPSIECISNPFSVPDKDDAMNL
jgi:hypothetical protein